MAQTLYKQVFIVGPDHNGSFEEDIANIPTGEGCLVIGDGKMDVSLSEIEAALKGNINEATRIDILAHGSVLPIDPTGTHGITLTNSIIPTLSSSLIKTLTVANGGKPVYSHWWNCFAANADKEFIYFPEGSMSVFHSTENVETSAVVGQKFHYDEYDNTVDGAKKNLVSDLESIIVLGGSVKFMKSGKEYTVKYMIPEIVKAHKGYLDFIFEYFHTTGEECELTATHDVERDLLTLLDKLKSGLGIADAKTIRSMTNEQLKLARDRFQMELLIETKNFAAIQQLVKDGVLDPNIPDKDGWTELMKAAGNGDYNAVAAFMAMPSININLQNIYGNTARDYAQGDCRALIDAAIAKQTSQAQAATAPVLSPTIPPPQEPKTLGSSQMLRIEAPAGNKGTKDGYTEPHHDTQSTNLPDITEQAMLAAVTGKLAKKTYSGMKGFITKNFGAKAKPEDAKATKKALRKELKKASRVLEEVNRPLANLYRDKRDEVNALYDDLLTTSKSSKGYEQKKQRYESLKADYTAIKALHNDAFNSNYELATHLEPEVHGLGTNITVGHLKNVTDKVKALAAKAKEVEEHSREYLETAATAHPKPVIPRAPQHQVSANRVPYVHNSSHQSLLTPSKDRKMLPGK